MFWLLVLPTVFFGVAVIVFLLARDSFRTSRAGQKPSAAASSAKKSGCASAINTMMQNKLPAPPPAHPATLFSGQNAKEADVFADTLARMKENPILPNTSNAYLRLEEHDNSLEHLLTRRSPGRREPGQAPPREFSIVVTEKEQASLEQAEAASDKKD
ncbi:MAG: hypothetical protein FWG59_01425 [Betaproteobacteria bacterium]|nr:hypothetical protein [Betaproteobacteria bacterium]